MAGMYQTPQMMGTGMNYQCANYNPYNPYSQSYNNYNNYNQAQQLVSQLPTSNVSNQMQMQIGNQFMKMVDSIEVVKATDIPMDGNYYYFPKADGSNIYAKKWLPNGTTHILTYKPIIENDSNNTTLSNAENVLGANSDVTKAFMDRFDRIEKLLAPYTETENKKDE